MKKVVFILLALGLLLTLCSCGDSGTFVYDPEPIENGTTEMSIDSLAGLSSPVAEYSSLEEINAAANVNIVLPEGYEFEDVSFVTIVDIAQYKFNYEGSEYSVRAANYTDRDISGVYVDDGTLFEGTDADYSTAGDGTYDACRFIVNGCQYVVYVEYESPISLDDSAFNTMCLAFMDAIDA